MRSGIDVLTIDDSANDLRQPEPELLPEDTLAPPALEVPGGVSERMGTLALQPETDGGEVFGELEETVPVAASIVPSEADDASDLLGEDEPVPEQVSQASPESVEAAVDKLAQPSETPDVRHGFLSLFASQIEDRDPEAATAVRELRDGGMAKGQTAERTETSHCGRMDELTGVQDPHSAIGGFFHDLGLLLPWGDALKTEYDRACEAWFAGHPQTLD